MITSMENDRKMDESIYSPFNKTSLTGIIQYWIMLTKKKKRKKKNFWQKTLSDINHNLKSISLALIKYRFMKTERSVSKVRRTMLEQKLY